VWAGRTKRNSLSAGVPGAVRRKLEDDPSRPVHLLTEAGMGYHFQQ
jgi:DNA-binding response OmpR family regulator